MSEHEDAVRYLACADVILLLAEMLGPPSTWSESGRDIAGDDLRALAAHSGVGGCHDGTAVLESALDEWCSVDPELATGEYHRLFDGAQACPSNETAYVRRDKGVLLADIAGFYRAFGFDLSEDFREKHDHIVAELQFTALLMVLVGRAVDEGRDAERDVAKDALVAFLRDHLGAWFGSFSERLEASAELPYYAAVARLCGTIQEALTQHFRLVPLIPTVGPSIDSGTPYECGMCMPVDSEPAR